MALEHGQDKDGARAISRFICLWLSICRFRKPRYFNKLNLREAAPSTKI